MTFYILPGNPPPNFHLREVYNRGYVYYKNTWERLFNRPNRPKLFDSFGYYRQNYIFQIEEYNQVICQTLATHYHLDNIISLDLPFFEKFYGEPLDYLKNKKIRSCLSLEYSSVGREFSTRNSNGLNMYKVIIQLAIRYAKNLDVCAVIGHPRRLTKTNDVTTEIGCKPLRINENKYGVSVDVSIGILKELRMYDDFQVNKLIEELWSDRIDTIGLTTGAQDTFYLQFLKTKMQNAEVA